jgi:hypothetical protein
MSKKTTKQSLEELHNLCSNQFGMITQMITDVNTKVNGLEKSIQVLQENVKAIPVVYGGGSGGGGGMNFTKIENKVDYLNEHFSSNVTLPLHYSKLLDFIYGETPIKNNDIVQILKGKTTIYDMCSLRIVELVDTNIEQLKFLHAFPFQKNVIYFWNHDKPSWDKLGNAELKKIFEVLQKKTIHLFNQMLQNNDESIINIDLVDCGERLFDENFDRKSSDFKKLIFNGLCSNQN